MAVMGLRINGGGGGIDTSLGDTFIKAMFGDADTEMQLARTRSQLANDEYQRNYTAALTAAAQEKAAREAAYNEAQLATVPARQRGILRGQQLSGEAPVAVEEAPTLDELPDAVDLDAGYTPVPVEVGDQINLPFAGEAPVEGVPQIPRFAMPTLPTATGGDMPVAVGGETDTYDPAVPAFGEVVQAALDQGYTPEEAEAIARATALHPTDPAGQYQTEAGTGGLLFDEGLALTPEQRTAMLATGSTPSNDSIVGGGAGGPDAKAAMELRKEIQRLPAYAKFAEVIPIYDSMIRSAQLDTRAAALDMVYALATIEDPGSVVRETDQVMVQRTGGLSAATQELISYINGGAPMTPDMKNELMQVASNRVGSYEAAFNQQIEQYRGIATRAGFDLADIIPTFGEREEYRQPLPPGVTEEQVQEYARAHQLTPAAARQILIERAAVASPVPVAPGGQ